jgi:hypothetical protein
MSDALKRSSAHHQRTYVENQGATVKDEPETRARRPAISRVQVVTSEQVPQPLLAKAPAGPAPAGETLVRQVRDHVAGRAQFDDITMAAFGRS